MAKLSLVLLHLKGRVRRVVDPREVYFLEADGDETIIRRRSARPWRDVRSLGEILPSFEPFGFQRIHERWAVNLGRVREIRPQADGRDLEVVMDPPVNRKLPVARTRRQGLLRRFH